MQKPNYNIEICDTLRRGFPNSNCTGFPIPSAHRVHWTNFYWMDVCIQKPYAVAIVQLIQIECNLLVCNHNSHTMYIVSTPTVLYCKFFRHHCSHNCPFKILYCKLLSSMEPYGIDSQMQKPNYNIEICDALRRGFPNSNCIGFPLCAVHRVHWTNL